MIQFSVGNSWRGCFILLILVLAVSVTGCSPEARHQVLTFFFTGVPPLGWQEELQRQQAEQVVAARRTFPNRHDRGGFVHGPYGSGECGSCHEMVPPRNPGEKPTRIVANQFVRPRDQMCLACHVEKSPDRARAEGLWLHGPSGNCLGCHHPHSSGQVALLRRDAGELCLSCHGGPGLIHSVEMHEGLTACLDCHNAHLGKDAMMLSWDYQENF